MQTARRASSKFKVTGAMLAAALVIAGCGSDDNGTSSTETTDATEPAATAATTGGAENAEAGGIECPTDATEGGTVEVLSIGWTEDIAVNHLWSELAAACGYEWEPTTADVGAIYTGIANDDAHLFMDAWLPATHSDYWEQFGDDIVDFNTWYEEAPLTWAVPTYVAENEGITSLEDLAGNAELFGGTVTGIESGAGLTRISKEEVIPTYGLGDEYELAESSTGAMLEALGSAIDDEEPILVTLWEPHSAYAKWDLTNLEDPEGALGEPDEIHTIASQSFEEEFPELSGWVSNFSMEGDALADLELKIEDAGEGNEGDAVATWVSENQDTVDEWFA